MTKVICNSTSYFHYTEYTDQLNCVWCGTKPCFFLSHTFHITLSALWLIKLYNNYICAHTHATHLELLVVVLVLLFPNQYNERLYLPTLYLFIDKNTISIISWKKASLLFRNSRFSKLRKLNYSIQKAKQSDKCW